MSVAATDDKLSLVTDPVLLQAVHGAVENSLSMCDTTAKCVAVASAPLAEAGIVTGMIGVHGNVSGYITVNLAEKVATALVSGLLQEQFQTITHDVIDGVGEITNIIAGGIKKRLARSPWAFSHVTVPSVIVGRNYQIAYMRGLEYLAVTFEHENADVLMLCDRVFQVAISCIRL